MDVVELLNWLAQQEDRIVAYSLARHRKRARSLCVCTTFALGSSVRTRTKLTSRWRRWPTPLRASLGTQQLLENFLPLEGLQ